MLERSPPCLRGFGRSGSIFAKRPLLIGFAVSVLAPEERQPLHCCISSASYVGGGLKTYKCFGAIYLILYQIPEVDPNMMLAII